MRAVTRGIVVGAIGIVALAAAGPTLAQGVTTRVSVRSDGGQANSDSFEPAITQDGRLVAFTSAASNLVAGDTNGDLDIFLRNGSSEQTTRVNLGPGGRQANNASFRPAVSPGGHLIAFQSPAADLVDGDTNGDDDIFVRDRRAATTSRASLGQTGRQGRGSSFEAAIAGAGRFVAFVSEAANLVPGDTNNFLDIFLRDRQAGTTSRLSVGLGGRQPNADVFEPSISANGRFTAFTSAASNLVAGDTNGARDVFVRDRLAGTTRRVSVGSGEQQANGPSLEPSISADGRFVAFTSEASNLAAGDTNSRADIYVRDRQTGTTIRVSVGPGGRQATGDSFQPSISANGRHIAFVSAATNLVTNDSNQVLDIFVRNREAGTTRRVNVGAGGAQANGDSFECSISGDGRRVAFDSLASNLVPNDTNESADVFVHDLAPPTASVTVARAE